MAVLKVTDSGNQVKRMPRTESVTIPVPTGENAPTTFSKALSARPGFTIAEVTPAVNRAIGGVKSYKVAVSRQRSVVVTGEWAGGAKKAGRPRAART